jgi:outer membrane protein assembly complex protein YaeT
VGSTVDLVFHIKEGPLVQLVFEGWNVSDDLKSAIRRAWSQGVIDLQRTADAVDLIESALIKERYFGFHVESAVENSNEEAKTVVFTIHPGSQYDELHVVFTGVHSVKESELQSLLKAAGYFNQGPRDREQAVPAIESFYRERGFIDVKVESPAGQLDEQNPRLTTVFPVTEGGLYHFGEIRFQGNSEFTNDVLLKNLKLGSETVFQQSAVIKARQTLQELYRKTGYNDATVQFTQVRDASRRVMDLTFNIQEKRQRIVQEILVEGNDKTSKGLVRSQLALEPGDILSDEKMSQARTNLYDAGAFAFVDIDVIALEPSPGLKPNQVPVRLVARVREVQPWELKYGGYIDTERGPGVITDFSNRNMLGNARVLGIQLRYDADLREGRAYFSQPVLRRLPVKSLFSAFMSHEEHTDKESKRTTITDQKGLSPSFEYKFRRYNTISLGYRLEMTHQFTAVPDPDFPESLVRTAPITTSFSRDTRDDPFDASYGHFTSHAVDWGTGTLGSDLRYIKYFGQYFDYLRLGKPTVVPWTRQVRNRLLLAFGARVGFLKGEPGQDFRTQQFKTGGGTTVRGFEQDKLGPKDTLGNPLGGDAELILNTELRFPLYKFFDGVAFVDAGNVYPTLHDFSPFDVRPSSGFGIRIRTPYLLLRLDYGINLKTKPGEPRGQFFFTFGQAF